MGKMAHLDLWALELWHAVGRFIVDGDVKFVPVGVADQNVTRIWYVDAVGKASDLKTKLCIQMSFAMTANLDQGVDAVDLKKNTFWQNVESSNVYE